MTNYNWVALDKNVACYSDNEGKVNLLKNVLKKKNEDKINVSL